MGSHRSSRWCVDRWGLGPISGRSVLSTGNGWTAELWDYALPLVRAGQLRFNLGTALGMHGLTAVIPLLVLLAAIVWCVPRAERLWVKHRVRDGE